jgi:hypothetical protein
MSAEVVSLPDKWERARKRAEEPSEPHTPFTRCSGVVRYFLVLEAEWNSPRTSRNRRMQIVGAARRGRLSGRSVRTRHFTGRAQNDPRITGDLPWLGKAETEARLAMISGDAAPSGPRLIIGHAAKGVDRRLINVAERCERCPRMGFALLYVGEQFCRLARRLLTFAS